MRWITERRKISELIPYEHNPRKITDKGKSDLKKSIDKFGLAEPVVINTNNIIIGGHARYFVMQERGDTACDCYVPERELTEQEMKELNVRLNKNIAGEFDWDILANEFEMEDLKEWGFDDKELSLGFPEEITEDEAPAVEEGEPDSKLGEVYELGRHRLMCGDATKKEDVEKLMDEVKADMVFTDPPYGVDYEGKTREKLKIKNDITTDVFKESLPSYILATKNGASFYVCCPPGNKFKDFFLPFEEVCHLSATIIWVKNSLVMGHGDYHYQHEPILYGWNKNGVHNFYGDRTNTTIWNVDRPSASKMHPTMKPIALVAKAIVNSSKSEDVILDLFGGSGSTLIAAEQTGRTCYMMELDPKYCDVIRKRYDNFVNNSDKQ